ncbi:TonB-dependent receptor domain-containing protein [Chitinophaga sp. 22321]|uniref:TonB-dependent receptor n=1 Tax=Chitinophaga hostae TaxID=2831022 RepID=A0ABS5J0S1_9BACT|nr:TonB-dependent receptor [Chitinophaga hostae]MBS0028157.1 TonB-dependent receptor [Chitinophaga hostae]
MLFKRLFQPWWEAIAHLCLLGMLILLPSLADAQQKEFTIRFSKGSLEQALIQLRATTNVSIAFNKADIQSAVVPTLALEHQSIDQILQVLLKGLPYTFEKKGTGWMILKTAPPVEQHPAKVSKGAIRGRIVDFETMQPLPGATLKLLPSGKGIVADEKGFYEWKEVPAGKYTLLISYVGYQPHTTAGLEVKDKTVDLDIKMLAGKSLEGVVISAGKERIKAVTYTTESQLLTEIRKSNAVVSGISNEQIIKTADRSAAEVVKRIAGVSVVDDRFVVIRGMAQRYNSTYLNNNIAPSTELYSRAFAYDLLPASIIDRILVYKSPSADLFGDYAGGAIKVFTKNAKPVRHLDVGLQLSYREGTTGKNMMQYKGGKLDWLGIDDGTRKLPANMGSMKDGSGLVNLKPVAERISGFNPDFSLYKVKALPDLQFYINYFDNCKLRRWRLYNLTSFTYQLDNRSYTLYRQTGNTNGSIHSIYTEHDKTGIEQQATQIARINLLQNFTLHFNNHHNVSFQNFFMNEGRNLTSSNIKEKNDAYAWLYGQTKTVVYSFQQRLLYAGNLNGTHYLRPDSATLFSWNLGYTSYLDKRPDQRRMNYNRLYIGSGAYNTEAEQADLRWTALGSNANSSLDLIDGMMSRFFQQSQQQTMNAAADITFTPIRNTSFKLGTYHLFRSREVARRYFKVNRYGVGGRTIIPTSDKPEEQPSDPVDNNQDLVFWRESDLPKLWSLHHFRNDGSGLELYDATTPVDGYAGSEQNNSGYVMTDWHPLNGKLIVNAGVRLEYNRQRVSAAISTGGFVLPVATTLEKTNILPSVNIMYTPLKELVIRGGYGRTVNRPDFKELSPFSEQDYIAQEVVSGNAQLVSATIDNYDLRLEWYPRNRENNEMFNIGVFYKHIQKPIERYRYDVNSYDRYNYTSISFYNPDQAKVYGLEAEIRKSLSFIPGRIFRRLSVNINGALIKSEIYNHVAVENSFFEPGNLHGRPLQGQAPYVLNAGLYYENAGLGTKIGLIYNVSGTSIYAVSPRNIDRARRDSAGSAAGVYSTRPSILELPRHLVDLSFTQRLYHSLQMKFTIQNLLDQAYRQAEDNNDNYKYDREDMKSANGKYGEGDNIFLKYNTGRFYNLSFTYAF